MRWYKWEIWFKVTLYLYTFTFHPPWQPQPLTPGAGDPLEADHEPSEGLCLPLLPAVYSGLGTGPGMCVHAPSHGAQTPGWSWQNRGWCRQRTRVALAWTLLGIAGSPLKQLRRIVKVLFVHFIYLLFFKGMILKRHDKGTPGFTYRDKLFTYYGKVNSRL